MSTDVSSHSTSASRDKLHLTRHPPIHAQHFTDLVTLHSSSTMFMPRLNMYVATYQVDLPVLNCSSWKVTFPTIFRPTYQRDPGVPLSKIGPT